jgi:hypothetical protein
VRGQHRALAAFYPRKRPGTHCAGGWVGPRAGLDRCDKNLNGLQQNSRSDVMVSNLCIALCVTNICLAPGFKKGKKPHDIDKSEDIMLRNGLVRKVYFSRYLHYIQLINKSSSGNKNVFLCGRDLLYVHTQLHINSNSSSDNSNVTAAAAFIVIIVIGHSNTYLLFQV